MLKGWCGRIVHSLSFFRRTQIKSEREARVGGEGGGASEASQPPILSGLSFCVGVQFLAVLFALLTVD